MLDRVGAFERGFTQADGGYLYYPSRWHGGYLVKQDEYDNLAAQWRAVTGWRGVVALVLLTVAIIASVSMVASFFGIDDDTVDAFMPFVVVIIIVPLLWKSSAAYRLVRKRTPVRPRRSSEQAERDMGRVLGRPMTIWIGVVSLCFLAWSALWAFAEPVLGVPALLLVGTATFFNLRMVLRSFRSQ